MTTEQTENDYLAPRDKAIWSLAYHTAAKFGCPVWFKLFEGNPFERTDSSLVWFVPLGGADFDRVKFLLFHEMRRILRPGYETPLDPALGEGMFYMPGLSMDVIQMDNPGRYVSSDQGEKITKAYLRSCAAEMKSRDGRWWWAKLLLGRIVWPVCRRFLFIVGLMYVAARLLTAFAG